MPNGKSSSPVERALWFVENRLADELSLQSVASAVGVSPHHLARAFASATSRSLMSYARGRRLTEAARRLAGGAGDIMSVALDCGYGSHGAFTRAFREEFGVTPEAFRRSPNGIAIHCTEPMQMDKSKFIELDPPRFQDGERIFVAGLAARYAFEASEGIPGQWQRFAPHIGHVPGQMGPEAYGVSCNFDEAGTFEYLVGVRVRDFTGLPNDLTAMTIEPRRYAVFTHRGHVGALHRVHLTIWNDWAPKSGAKIASAPSFELYTKDFNPMTGLGGIEMWVPVDG